MLIPVINLAMSVLIRFERWTIANGLAHDLIQTVWQSRTDNWRLALLKESCGSTA